MLDDQTNSEPWYSQNSLFKHFQDIQRYSGISMHIQPQSQDSNKGMWGKGETFWKKGP